VWCPGQNKRIASFSFFREWYICMYLLLYAPGAAAEDVVDVNNSWKEVAKKHVSSKEMKFEHKLADSLRWYYLIRYRSPVSLCRYYIHTYNSSFNFEGVAQLRYSSASPIFY
jgi:hypothetical protein